MYHQFSNQFDLQYLLPILLYQKNADKQKKADRAKKVSETIEKSNERVKKSLDNLKKLGGNLNAGFDPRVAVDLGKIAAEKVYQGVVKFDKLVKDSQRRNILLSF